MDEPAGSAVVVGAGGGIGAALIRALAAQGRYPRIFGLGRRQPHGASGDGGWSFVETDILDEDSIAAAAARIAQAGPVSRIVVATGLLHGPGVSPEKAMRSLDAGCLQQLFSVNAIAPALIAKHFLPLAPREAPSLFAALSARVGSISDNRLGGWYGYRASKAALNMMIATLAIEQARARPLSVCVALHPGTVDTALSAPFTGASRSPRLTPDRSAQALVAVMDSLTPADTGGFFAWDGKPIGW